MPTKPASPALQPAHPFAASLTGAWLFVEGTGHTVADFSSFGHHLTGTGYSDGSWGADGLDLEISMLTVGSSQSDFNFADTEPWTQIIWHRRNGLGHAGPFDRFCARPANVVDMALQANDNYGPAYFDGLGWINPQQGSAVSGADAMWAFVYTPSDSMKIYKNAVLLDSRLKVLASTGQLYFNSPQTNNPPAQEYLDGVWISSFFHRRALDITELASHYSNPYVAFTAPQVVGVSGLGFNFSLF